MVYAHKVNTREELLQRILSAARNINKAAVFRMVTVLWSHVSDNVSKQKKDTSNNLFESLNITLPTNALTVCHLF